MSSHILESRAFSKNGEFTTNNLVNLRPLIACHNTSKLSFGKMSDRLRQVIVNSGQRALNRNQKCMHRINALNFIEWNIMFWSDIKKANVRTSAWEVVCPPCFLYVSVF